LLFDLLAVAMGEPIGRERCEARMAIAVSPLAESIAARQVFSR
jgi:hypothetical protein